MAKLTWLSLGSLLAALAPIAAQSGPSFGARWTGRADGHLAGLQLAGPAALTPGTGRARRSRLAQRTNRAGQALLGEPARLALLALDARRSLGAGLAQRAHLGLVAVLAVLGQGCGLRRRALLAGVALGAGRAVIAWGSVGAGRTARTPGLGPTPAAGALGRCRRRCGRGSRRRSGWGGLGAGRCAGRGRHGRAVRVLLRITGQADALTVCARVHRSQNLNMKHADWV